MAIAMLVKGLGHLGLRYALVRAGTQHGLAPRDAETSVHTELLVSQLAALAEDKGLVERREGGRQQASKQALGDGLSTGRGQSGMYLVASLVVAIEHAQRLAVLVPERVKALIPVPDLHAAKQQITALRRPDLFTPPCLVVCLLSQWYIPRPTPD